MRLKDGRALHGVVVAIHSLIKKVNRTDGCAHWIPLSSSHVMTFCETEEMNRVQVPQHLQHRCHNANTSPDTREEKNRSEILPKAGTLGQSGQGSTALRSSSLKNRDIPAANGDTCLPLPASLRVHRIGCAWKMKIREGRRLHSINALIEWVQKVMCVKK